MKRMLIDAAHPEETRVIIVDNNKIDDFEVETQGKQQLKGNIYIGHVSRVEPSLQAAFITYGGNRNGFLAFGEVHPQFFALKDDEKKELLEELAAQAARRRGAETDDAEEAIETTKEAVQEMVEPAESVPAEAKPAAELSDEERADAEAAAKAAAMADAADSATEGNTESKGKRGRGSRAPRRAESRGRPQRVEASSSVTEAAPKQPRNSDRPARDEKGSKPQPSIHRRHRIQDVLKEGQKILVQVVKEERGSKGAALTTYFSLPGRYTVLMPNTPYAGGISRKITDPEERRQLRRAYAELEVPDTMGLIIRTAGVGQDISHIKRDYENLTNLWQHIITEFEGNEDIQCIHEDGSVIIRALRDMMSDDIEDITISGARAYKMAKDYAKNLMPDVVTHIKQHKEETPLFTQAKVENKLNMLHHNRVTLPSGGYLIIDPTEALVAVDINSGRATQERNIEETALKTNLEACEELARQIRLRDLAGLIVVDFIDMEDHRNVRKVESALRKALRRDRARIQTGSISDFGLMEISRQRLRPSFGESHFVSCAHCQGTGLVHSPATSALMVLRKLEEDDVRDADRIIVSSSTDMILWLLNHKRDLIRSLEERYKYQLQFRTDDSLVAPDHKLELINIKADGSETSKTLEVILREQPELPPELRQRGNGRREREDEPRRERSERPEKQADTKRERDNRKPEDKDNNRKPRQSEKGAREDKSAAAGNSKRPRRIGEESPTASSENGTATAESQNKAPRGKQAPARKESKPAEKKATGPKQPSRASALQAKVEDQPLAVQKVSVDTSDDPIITAAPRKKFEVKKQADTDAADAPIAVAKVSSDDSAAPAARAAAKKEKEKTGSGLISRLIGR